MAESYRIAIADDEPVVVAFVRECLVRAGHSVVAEARSGEQLVQLCTTVVPDLIITDIKMGETDGITAVETILATHDLPVVVLSAYHSDDFIERANDCHVLAYLVKPIREEELLTAITVAMCRFDELKTLREEATGMRQALEDRKLIERAKGIIMLKRQLDEPAAFHYLQQLARSHRQKLVDIAKSVILAEPAFDPHSQATKS